MALRDAGRIEESLASALLGRGDLTGSIAQTI